MSIKKILKNNRYIYWIIKQERSFQYNVLERIFFEINAILRKCGIISSPIKKLKNKYYGKRCFIIATGPSLTIKDVTALKNEYTMGMNSLCKIFPELGWETTFYGIQDFNVYKSLNSEIKNLTDTILLCGSNLKQKFKLPKTAITFPLDLLNHKMHPDDYYNTYFSEDCNIRVYDGYTITYSLIQLAVYFGFKEIYLLGCDCSYTGSQDHFVDHGVCDQYFSTAQNRLFFSYEVAFEYAKKNNIQIYNATRGGALEIFPRVNFDDLITY